MSTNTFGARKKMSVNGQSFTWYDIAAAGDVARLPYSLKILLENLLRREDGRSVTKEDIEAIAAWDPQAQPSTEIAFMPARVLLQ
ncbi:MAG: hypothetical protein R8K47_07225, partial [Mariprofundaceae bacterium]